MTFAEWHCLNSQRNIRRDEIRLAEPELSHAEVMERVYVEVPDNAGAGAVYLSVESIEAAGDPFEHVRPMSPEEGTGRGEIAGNYVPDWAKPESS
jgi:hypothetical protein